MKIGTATVTSSRPIHGLTVAQRKRRKDATKLSEDEFMRQVVEFAKMCGWRVYHTHDSRRSESGFPDLILVKGRTILAWELKVEPNTASAAQDAWIDALRHAGVDARVVYPRHWDSIEEELRARK